MSADLIECLPLGYLATRQWLLERGISRHTVDNALKSGKVEAVVRGVVKRREVPLDWRSVAASLDRMSPRAVYVGGLSALSHMGLGHYLKNTAQVDLYSSLSRPAWLARLSLKEELVWHGTVRLWDEEAVAARGSLRIEESPLGARWKVARPEQAILEVLADVPAINSFEHADVLMQGLSMLSPRRMDALLRACRHVKAKRLFFYFADRYEYPWRRHVQPQDYDLGAGKRSVVPGGKLDKTYLITVPEYFHGSG